MIDLKELYDKTNAGLDIIHLYYPEAEPGKPFRMRDERTPSAYVKLLNGVYKVTDFGSDAVAKSPIDVAMQNEGLPFYQTICKLAGIFHCENYVTAETSKPTVTYADAAGQPNTSCCDLVLNEAFTPEELKFWHPSMKAETLERYGWSSVKSYTVIKDGKRMTYASNPTYPMFVRNCGEFQKLYKPYDFKSRFQCIGNRPHDYVNGLNEVTVAFNKYTSEIDDEDTGETVKVQTKKLPECIICSGERDSMVAAMLGYLPVWFNSETAHIHPSVIAQLGKMCDKIYNVPDADSTGVERGNIVALDFPDIYTVELPSWLSQYRDAKGKPRKDLRDYCELRDGKGLAQDFRNLLISAKCCQFWEWQTTDRGTRIVISSSHLLQYLKASGFRKIRNDKDYTIVRIAGDIITRQTATDVRDFIISEVRRRNLGKEVLDRVLDDKKTSSTIAADLETIQPDTTAYTPTTQTFRFTNHAVTVSAQEVKVSRQAPCLVYSEKVVPHAFRRLEPAFKSDGSDIECLDTSSHLFRFLINASRIYWRQEYETDDAAADAAYIEGNHYTISGLRLTEAQIAEQKRHLINKLYAIGYVLHRYKDASNALALWVMENKITGENTSSGGSGKSFVFKALSHLLNIISFNGSEKDLTKDKHLLGGVTDSTDLLLLQDFKGNEDNFRYFYTAITDNMSTNRKFSDRTEIDFQRSPKVAFTSNFAPPIKMNDSSSFRRLLFLVYSDYYHARTEDNGYKETRTVADDFGGKNIYDMYYPESDYNEDFNFMIDCLQFYLQMRAKGVKCNAPMDNVLKRIRRQSVGDNFIDWADLYFAQDGDHLDCFVPLAETIISLQEYSGLKHITTQSFKQKLKDWCSQTDYIVKLNPDEYCDKSGKRIIRRLGGESREHIYIVSKRSQKADTEPDSEEYKEPF